MSKIECDPNQINWQKDANPSVFAPLSEATGVPKEILFERLLETLKMSRNYSEGDIEDIRRVYEYADNAFRNTPGKDRRESGDEFITHPLWMAVFISERITTDKEVIVATILHDNPEDTGMTLDEVEKISSPGAANLVEILTKVRSTKVIEARSPAEANYFKKHQKELDDKNTQLKLLNSFERDIRAFIIKGTDVLHNQKTSKFMPKEKRKEKAKRALDFYEPILRRLGFTNLADEIGENAFKSVKLPSYDYLARKKAESDEIMLPIFKGLYESLPEPDTDAVLPPPSVVQVVSPSVYEADKKFRSGLPLKESFMPHVEAIFETQGELFEWHRMLRDKLQAKTNNGGNVDESLDASGPVIDSVTLGEDEDEIKVDFHLYDRDSLIKPAHLFTDNIELDNRQQEIALNKLASIIKHYRQELTSGSDVVESVKEAAQRGTIEVYDIDGTPRSVPGGATAADFAFIRGKNLGRDAVGATIYKMGIDGKWQPDKENSGLSRELCSGEKVVIKKIDNSMISPSKYESVTTKKAITDIRNFVDETLKEIGLKDRDIKRLYKGISISRLYTLLRSKVEGLTDEKRDIMDKFVISVEERGAEILDKLYYSVRGKKLDSFNDWVFDDKFSSRFKDINAMYFYIGLTPVPFREGEFLEKWQNFVRPGYEAIGLSNNFVGELIRFRGGRVTMQIKVPNQLGVIAEIGSLAEKHGLSILTVRNRNINNPRQTQMSVIEIVFENGTLNEITTIMGKIWDKPEYNQVGFEFRAANSNFVDEGEMFES